MFAIGKLLDEKDILVRNRVIIARSRMGRA
jgi:hypothetical protein